MATVKKQLAALSRRGPYKVLVGDLAVAGLPGSVYAPESGNELPAVAFGHDWLTTSRNYRNTAEHVASWGIVVGCPDTERGPIPSSYALAQDLSTTLSIVSQVRLGPGKITVHPHRLGVLGHGFGASAAVLAAANDDRISALAALYPAPAGDEVLPAAHRARVPALILAAPGELNTVAANALPLRNALQGDEVSLRTVPKSTQQSLVDGFTFRKYFTGGGRSRSANSLTRAMLTGFLLHRLRDDKTYAAFSDPAAALGKLTLIDPLSVADDGLDRFSRLIRS